MKIEKQILKAVARETGVSEEQILDRNRQQYLVDARRLAALTFRSMGWSFPQIGRALLRNHATIISLCKSATQDEWTLAASLSHRVLNPNILELHEENIDLGSDDVRLWVLHKPRTGESVTLPHRLSRAMSDFVDSL